ncbi:MAG: Nramp family divalent metal transporter [Chloroflexi bacterium]|nr:Nramp family divalent metal transporter [Chloroflexota bacterium]MBI5711883.1 Nramp family divalent metal transporter [Chloroflexota bacterium]
MITTRTLSLSPFKLFQTSIKQNGWNYTLKRIITFLGPAFLVSVGYMDPGNWGTDIEGGSRFGYSLLWVILISNLMAILLQTLSAKLGLATGKTLPELCREHYSKPVAIFLWITAEFAAIATDLAEVLGGAVAFNLLFNIPLFYGALLTGAIVGLILMLEEYNLRRLEMIIIGMVAIIGIAYVFEIFLAQPLWGDLAIHMVTPTLPMGSTLIAVGIIGATVMPHNLYLHSALIQSRRRSDDDAANRKALTLSTLDSVIALNGAWLVNSAILIMSAAVFYNNGLEVTSIQEAHKTLAPLLGPLSAGVFALALLASGLSSSTTATMAGQVIMEGFLHFRVNVWLRRAVTIVPALIVIGMGLDPLQILVMSQVSLSFQLPLAVIPLILFTNNRAIMGEYANRKITTTLALISAAVIIGLNALLIWQSIMR